MVEVSNKKPAILKSPIVLRGLNDYILVNLLKAKVPDTRQARTKDSSGRLGRKKHNCVVKKSSTGVHCGQTKKIKK